MTTYTASSKGTMVWIWSEEHQALVSEEEYEKERMVKK